MAMKLGTEDKKKRLIAMVAVSLALTFVAHLVWQMAGGSSSAPPPPPPAVTQTRTTPTTTSGTAAQHLESASTLDPTLHPERMAFAENTRYTGTSRNIFSKDSLPPAPAVVQIEKPVASVRTGQMAISNAPPPPPPIDLKFYGFATEKDGRKLVFLMHGEDIFVAGQGDIVEGRYKVLQIGNTTVEVDDLSYNNTQSLSLQT